MHACCYVATVQIVSTVATVHSATISHGCMQPTTDSRCNGGCIMARPAPLAAEAHCAEDECLQRVNDIRCTEKRQPLQRTTDSHCKRHSFCRLGVLRGAGFRHATGRFRAVGFISIVKAIGTAKVAAVMQTAYGPARACWCGFSAHSPRSTRRTLLGL